MTTVDIDVIPVSNNQWVIMALNKCSDTSHVLLPAIIVSVDKSQEFVLWVTNGKETKPANTPHTQYQSFVEACDEASRLLKLMIVL